MQSVITALLNIVTVSFWEELVWVGITLVLIGRVDLLDWRRWKRNIKWLLIPILSVAISINILKYILHIPKPIMSISTLILMIVLIIYISKTTDKIGDKWLYLKSIIYSAFAIFIISTTETFYSPLILYRFKISIDVINSNIWYNFLCSTPSRLIQFILLGLLIYNKLNNIKFNKIFVYFKDKVSNVILIITLLTSISVILFLVNVFTNFTTIQNYDLSTQLLISAIIFILPTIILGVILFIHVYNTQKIINIEQKYSSMLEDNEK